MLLKSGLKSKSRQKINLATAIFMAVAYASLAELVDAHLPWECGEIHRGSNP